ncbi:MAG: NAD(P)H-dependent oxidoreductase [Bacteroidales bacterium]|nr:NAD(P)H-dependent oxidoreductase [Bacteroidales bacterium]
MKKIALLITICLLTVNFSFSQKAIDSKMLAAPTQLSSNNGRGVLVLVAHPNLKESTANKALSEVAKSIDEVEVVDLYSLKKFDVEDFKEKVAGVSAIVFQFPFYYASAPAKMKEWIDDVFYMFPKDLVQGKALLVVTTTGSEEAAYHSGARNMFTVDELLRPYQLTAHHSGMIWQTPLVVYGMSTKEAEKNLSTGEKEYRNILEKLKGFKVPAVRKAPQDKPNFGPVRNESGDFKSKMGPKTADQTAKPMNSPRPQPHK